MLAFQYLLILCQNNIFQNKIHRYQKHNSCDNNKPHKDTISNVVFLLSLIEKHNLILCGDMVRQQCIN